MNEKQKNNVNEKNNKNVKAKKNVNVRKKTKKKKKNGIVNKENVQSDKPCKSVNPKKKKAKSKAQPQKNAAQKVAQQSKSKKKKKQKQSKNSFLPRQLEDVSECKRTVLGDCYKCTGYGTFVGEVTKIEDNRIYFQHLLVQWKYGLASFDGYEHNIWIYDSKPFKNKKIGIKDMAGFEAEVFVYKKKDNTKELGIRNIKYIEKLPPLNASKEELAAFIEKHTPKPREIPQWLKCETCVFTDHCDGVVCLKGDF